MSGSKSGVAKRVQDEEPRAVFTHCYCHSLNFAANDSVKKSNVIKSSMEMTHEITKLIKLSPRRDAIFHEVKAESDLVTDCKHSSIQLLCPTWWTVWANSLLSILNNYSALKYLGKSLGSSEGYWEQGKDPRNEYANEHIQFSFWDNVGRNVAIICHTDNLSRFFARENLFCGRRTADWSHGSLYSSGPQKWWVVWYILVKCHK